MTRNTPNSNQDLWISFLLSMQRALWEMVTPDLRGVSVEMKGREARARFIYDRPVTEEHTEIVSEVETEVMADLWQNCHFDFKALFIPVGVRMEDVLESDTDTDTDTEELEPNRFSSWAYLRREARA